MNPLIFGGIITRCKAKMLPLFLQQGFQGFPCERYAYFEKTCAVLCYKSSIFAEKRCGKSCTVILTLGGCYHQNPLVVMINIPGIKRNKTGLAHLAGAVRSVQAPVEIQLI